MRNEEPSLMERGQLLGFTAASATFMIVLFCALPGMFTEFSRTGSVTNSSGFTHTWFFVVDGIAGVAALLGCSLLLTKAEDVDSDSQKLRRTVSYMMGMYLVYLAARLFQKFVL